LALRLKPGNHLSGVHARLDDLQSDDTADRLFLLRHVDHAEAAFADPLQQLIRTYEVADLLRGRIGDESSREYFRWILGCAVWVVHG
jgi:hypothetical protein